MKNSGKISDSFFAWMTAAGAAGALAAGLFRPWWFDEALTLFNFILLPDATAIYKSYVIPNNHIVYTVMAHWFVRLAGNEVLLRLLSWACGAATLVLAWKFFRFRRGWALMRGVIALYAWSMAFWIYSTAVRGYMAGALLVLLFWMALDGYSRKKKGTCLAVALAVSAAGCGVMPGDLFALGAVALFCGRGRIGKTLLFGSLAVAGFLLFYLPIFPELLAASRLGESSSSRGEAIFSAYAMLLPAGGLPLAGMLYSLFSRRRKVAGAAKNFRVPWEQLLIWLFPLLFGLAWQVAPFPRIYFPWQMLLLYLMVQYARSLISVVRRHPLAFAGLLLLWGAIWRVPAVNESVSENLGGAWGDDYFAPYYMRKEFDPAAVLARLPEGAENRRVYASFDADMWAMLYAGAGRYEIVFDGPRSRADKLEKGDFVILRRGEDVAELEKRFGKMRKIGVSGLHEILQTE